MYFSANYVMLTSVNTTNVIPGRIGAKYRVCGAQVHDTNCRNAGIRTHAFLSPDEPTSLGAMLTRCLDRALRLKASYCGSENVGVDVIACWKMRRKEAYVV